MEGHRGRRTARCRDHWSLTLEAGRVWAGWEGERGLGGQRWVREAAGAQGTLARGRPRPRGVLLGTRALLCRQTQGLKPKGSGTGACSEGLQRVGLGFRPAANGAFPPSPFPFPKGGQGRACWGPSAAVSRASGVRGCPGAVPPCPGPPLAARALLCSEWPGTGTRAQELELGPVGASSV